MTTTTEYYDSTLAGGAWISLEKIKSHTYLPIGYLRILVMNGDIPYLQMGRRQFFYLPDVLDALSVIATNQAKFIKKRNS